MLLAYLDISSIPIELLAILNISFFPVRFGLEFLSSSNSATDIALYLSVFFLYSSGVIAFIFPSLSFTYISPRSPTATSFKPLDSLAVL